VITEGDIEKAIGELNYGIKPFDIVLLYTGSDSLWGTSKYFSHFVGVSREGLARILDLGVKVVGIDAFSFDRPLPRMVNDYLKTGDNSNLWPAHLYGREKEYCHIERLANLERVPSYGFKVACFPVKIKDVGAAAVRAVAFVE
jgi:kynurenine formamidase